MSRKGLDSIPVDPDAVEQSAPSVSPQAPVAPAPAPVASSTRPAFGRPSQPASAQAAGASVSPGNARPAFGRPQPPSRPAPGPVSQSTRPAVASRPPAAPARSASPVPASAPSHAFNAPQAASDTGRAPAPAVVSDLFTGYTKLVESNSRRKDGLPLRLERLIDEISDFQGYSDEHRENAKLRAVMDPATWEKKLSDYYVNTIRPQRARTAQTLEEARQKNPGKVVYVEVKKGKPEIMKFDRDSARGREEALLDGATVEVVFASRTPFLAPREVFGAADVKQEVDASEVAGAFEEPATTAAKSPRP